MDQHLTANTPKRSVSTSIIVRLLFVPLILAVSVGTFRPTTGEGWTYTLSVAAGLSGLTLFSSRKMVLPIVFELACGLALGFCCVAME
jgi:hypothetical protein